MQTSSETNLKARFAEFSGVTQFHGFLELYHSKSLYGKIFWTIIVILGFVASSHSIYNDTIIFLRRPTATIIKPLDTEEEYYAPKFIFCYPSWIYWVDFHRLKIKNISKPALLAGLSFLGDVVSETEFDPAEAKREFLDFMSDHNFTSIGQFYKSIARKAPVSFFWSDKIPLNRENQTPYFKKIDIIKQQNTIMVCYITDSATLLRSLFPIKKNSNSPLFNKNDYGVLYKKLNFSMKSVVYDEEMGDFVTKMEYNVYISRWLALQTNLILSKDEDYKKDYTQFVLPLLVFPNGDDLTRTSKLDLSVESYTITFVGRSHDRLSNRQRGCDAKRIPENTDKNCEQKCSILYQEVEPPCLEINKALAISIDFPRNLCSYRFIFISKIADFSKLPYWTTSLVPFLDRKRPADSLLGLPDGQQLVERKYLKSMCEKNCSRPCIEWRYSYSVFKFYYDQTGELNHSDTKIILVYPTAKTVMIYQDVYLKNYFNILGDIGGILGVWIGGSIISILQFLYIFIIKRFCDCQAIHSNVSEADEDSEETDRQGRFVSKKKSGPKIKVTFKGNRVVAVRSLN